MIGSMFALRETLMESASFYNNDVTPFNFMNEDTCFNEANIIIAETMNDITSFSYEGQSLIVENASNPRVEVLMEGFFASFGEKIKKFFENMKKLFLGIYDRMRAYAAKLTGNTSKWLQIMTPRIKEKKTAKGIDELEVTLYKDNLNTASSSDSSANTVIGGFEALYDACKNTEANTVDVAEYKLGEDIDKEKRVEEELKKAIDAIAAKLGVKSTSADNVEDFLKDFNDALFDETEDKKVASNADAFLESIKKCTKTVNDTTKEYKKIIDAIDKCKKNMDSMASKLKNKDSDPTVNFVVKGDNEESNVRYSYEKANKDNPNGKKYAEFRTRLAATFEVYSTVCSKVSTIFNGTKNAKIKWIKENVNRQMNALTKMAYFKEKKES